MAHSLNAVPVDKLENFLVCPICKDILKDPRTLPNCFHSYCRTCLETFVKNVRDEAPSGRRIREFNCPICRNPFTLNPEDKVEDMGRSHFIYNILEVMAVDQHHVKGVPCTHCQRPSVGRCVTCEAFLCQECLKIHNSFLGFKDHVVLSMDELSKPENQAKVRGKLQCSVHKKKTLKFYCETCQELVCRYCMDFNHEKPDHCCRPVEDVAEKEKQILVSSSAALEDKLMEGKSALKKVINAKQSLEKVKEQTKQDINQRKDNLLKEVTRQLNDQAQHLLKEVDKVYVGKHNTLVQQEAQIKCYVAKLESCVSLSKGLLEKGTDEEILSSTKMMKRNIEKLSNETLANVESVDDNIICYQRNPIVPKFSVITEQMGRVTAGPREKLKPLFSKSIPIRKGNPYLAAKSQNLMPTGDSCRKLESYKKRLVNSSTAVLQDLPKGKEARIQQGQETGKTGDDVISLNLFLFRYIYNFHWNEIQELENVCKEIKHEVKPDERVLHLTAKDDSKEQFKKALDQFISLCQKLSQKMHQEVIPLKSKTSTASPDLEDTIGAARRTFPVIISNSEQDDSYLVYGEKDAVEQAVKFIEHCSANPTSVPGNGRSPKPLSYDIAGRTKLLVCEGDLTEEVVDVIVNPANGSLDHVSGTARAIVKKGGKEIQRESNEIVRKYGKIPTGRVAYTKPGSLPCKFILHAVGPVWDNRFQHECRQHLGNACFESLAVACKLGAETIAIPAISSGIYNMPLDVCAEVLFNAVEHFCNSRQNSEPTLRQIRFLNNKKETVDVFEREMMKRYGSKVTRGSDDQS